ncbi:MAG TPA: carboxymuconolactone decarboxylase family protein [Acidimicrobiia bacterium]|nr:carboxymuconolactone decarboxylase family protein [Acidimicrobiia bacterium]
MGICDMPTLLESAPSYGMRPSLGAKRLRVWVNPGRHNLPSVFCRRELSAGSSDPWPSDRGCLAIKNHLLMHVRLYRKTGIVETGHTGLMPNRPNKARVEPLPKALEEAKEAMKSSAVNAANVTATLAHNEMVSVGVGRFSRQLLFKGTVPPRLREIVILRMGWNCQSVYEFGQHTLFGLDVGLTEDEIYWLTRPVREYGWAEDEIALLEMVDDLYGDDCVSDATWLKLAGLFSVSEMLEFMAAALQYRLVSGLLNSCGVQRDDGVPGWPQAPTT